MTGICSPLPGAGVWNEAVSSPRCLRVGTGGTVCASVFTRVISERFTDALQERLTIHVHILGINGESCCLKRGRENAVSRVSEEPDDKQPFCGTNCPSLSTSWRTPYSIPYVVQVGTITPPHWSTFSAPLTEGFERSEGRLLWCSGCPVLSLFLVGQLRAIGVAILGPSSIVNRPSSPALLY